MVSRRSSSKAVSTMASPLKIGDEWPGGSGVVQTMLVSGPKVTGNGPLSMTPEPFGPRKRSQWLPGAARTPISVKPDISTASAATTNTPLFI